MSQSKVGMLQSKLNTSQMNIQSLKVFKFKCLCSNFHENIFYHKLACLLNFHYLDHRLQMNHEVFQQVVMGLQVSKLNQEKIKDFNKESLNQQSIFQKYGQISSFWPINSIILTYASTSFLFLSSHSLPCIFLSSHIPFLSNFFLMCHIHIFFLFFL